MCSFIQAEKTVKWNEYHAISQWNVVSRTFAHVAAEDLEKKFSSADREWKSKRDQVDTDTATYQARQVHARPCTADAPGAACILCAHWR